MFLYTTADQLSGFDSYSPKIILIGSDGGWGNFGDIAQHLSTLDFLRGLEGVELISVLDSAPFMGARDPERAATEYGADAVLFHSSEPLTKAQLGNQLVPVSQIRNPLALHLYGGGFLNEFWGREVLDLVEFFLDQIPGLNYVISGQQITPPFNVAVAKHVDLYRPSAVGVRDESSGLALNQVGVEHYFSFDDAVDFFANRFNKVVQPVRGVGAALHLNLSGYSGQIGAPLIQKDLADLGTFLGDGPAPLTVLQAYTDQRIDVRDSIESVKQFGFSFPFLDFRLLLLTPLTLSHQPGVTSLEAGFGYSSSYHVALWLQLAGIPCWLPSFNSFYEQKAEALGISQSLSSFLREPFCPSYQNSLARRELWLANLRKIYEGFEARSAVFLLSVSPTSNLGVGRVTDQEIKTDNVETPEVRALRQRVRALTSILLLQGVEVPGSHSFAYRAARKIWRLARRIVGRVLRVFRKAN